MRKLLGLALIFAALVASAADEAKWVAYPGDYGVWWGNALQARRLKWCNRMAPSWPLYAPYPCVTFRKTVAQLEKPVTLKIEADGTYAIGCTSMKVDEFGPRLGAFTVPAGSNVVLHVNVFNAARPPALRVSGEAFATPEGWTADWGDGAAIPAETFAAAGAAPGLAELPTKPVEPVKTWRDKQGRLFADFGEETYGYLKLRDVKGKGALKIVYAESLAEAEAEAFDVKDDYKTLLDGWELAEIAPCREHRRPIPAGFRYVCVRPWSGDVSVGSLAMDFQWKDVPERGAFVCDDAELNRIWQVSAHTISLVRREVIIEAVKRDHWVWGGDSKQAFLIDYYASGDYEGVRNTLWTLRGKDPVHAHLSGIMDYSYYWFDAVHEYGLYSGDTRFYQQVYPRMKSMMDWCIGRLNAEGRPRNHPKGDWVFIDWAPEWLDNYDGVTSTEQMLFVRALEATATVAEATGHTADARAYRRRATLLRDEVKPRYWNEERGGLMHIIKDDGKFGRQFTRYPNIFGVLFGYFTPAERDRVLKDVLFNDQVMRIQTPYMQFYEMDGLCELGMQERMLARMKAYWGGMLKLGATSFWELYNPSEKGNEHYAMYGRDFGRSLCHAWGASPIYLLGKYYLGVRPTGPGFSTYEVRPALGGLKWMKGKVPTPQGEIAVSVDANGVTVTGVPNCRGRLHWNGEVREIAPGATVRLGGAAPKGAAGPAAKARPAGAVPFKPGEVVVGGEIARRMQVTVDKMIRHTDIENVFAKHFRERREVPCEPGGFAGYGMFLDALVKAAAHGIGGEETVRTKERLFKEIVAAQREDGSITMYLGKPGYWDAHEGAYFIQAFVRDWRWFGNRASLAAAVKLADSLLARKALTTLGTEQAFAMLYEATKDARYLAYLKEACGIEGSFDAYDRSLQVNSVQHVYTYLARALAQLSLPERADSILPAEAALARAHSPYLSVSGSMSGGPRWGEVWDETQAGVGKWGETCVSAYLMRLAAKMAERTDGTDEFDLYERVMYNAFFSAQSADGLKYRYWTPFNEKGPWFGRDTYCCPNNYRRMVFEIPDAVFRRSEAGLSVCLYAPAELKAEGYAAKMATEYPKDGKIALDVTMAAGKTLRLRIPAWCRGATVSVAGGAAESAAVGWHEVRADFSRGLHVELNLPMPVRAVRGIRAQAGRVAFMRGPCVYALETAVNGIDAGFGTQSLDLWDVVASVPPRYVPEREAIEVTARTRYSSREEKKLLLTRYCRDERERTYFNVIGPIDAVADELVDNLPRRSGEAREDQ